MTIPQHQISRLSTIVLLALAGSALLIGVVIYVLDRPVENIYFLTQWTTTGSNEAGVFGHYFGALGQHLPTFLHTYGFILLTTTIVVPYWKYHCDILWVCIVWFVIESLFEIAQMDFIAHAIASLVPAGFNNIPFFENTSNYFIAGTFDVLDLLSIVVGSLTAYLTIMYLYQKESCNEPFTKRKEC